MHSKHPGMYCKPVLLAGFHNLPHSINCFLSLFSLFPGLKAESSNNTFIENLRATRNFETDYYVTDTKQSTDFILYRNSKIRINIGVSDVEMIPAYTDMTYNNSSDNQFMANNPNTVDEKIQFKRITERHCR